MNEPSPFPQAITEVSEGERILEAFGWAPSAWALFFFAFVILVIFQRAELGTGGNVAVSLSFIGGCGLAFYEYRRRRQPRVLVRRGQGLSLYARGALLREVDIAAAGIYIRHPSRTWGPILMTAMATVATGAFLMPGIALPWSERLGAALAALGFASLCSSIVRTRLFCEEALIPYANGAGFQHLLVLRRDVPRIFSRTT